MADKGAKLIELYDISPYMLLYSKQYDCHIAASVGRRQAECCQALREDFTFGGVANRRLCLKIWCGKDAISLHVGLASRSISAAGLEGVVGKKEPGRAESEGLLPTSAALA